MKILITGTNTINKGAELMLYAILQEIERKIPTAKVLFPYSGISEGVNYIKTQLDFKQLSGYTLYKIFKIIKGEGICRKLHLKYPFCTDLYPHNNIDIIFDAGGFQFSDQFWIDDYSIKKWQNFLTKEKQKGTKIVFLPQAFGPFQKKIWHPLIKTLGETATLVIPREEISASYLKENNFPPDKIKIYPDFTSLVKGSLPNKFDNLKNGVAIIPNIQMINTGQMNLDAYIDYLHHIILKVQESNHIVYLLNHEGKRDYELCCTINNCLSQKIPIVNNLNAIEIKGLIASSYLVISSRFHGVASALSSAVPCLSTSWSHKYQLLYDEYKLENAILDINNSQTSLQKIELYLSKEFNTNIRNVLSAQKKELDKKSQEMWNFIWEKVL